MPNTTLNLFLLLFQLFWIGSHADNLYGCSFEPSVCSLEEVCSEDGLFGHCQPEGSVEENYDGLSNEELDLLRLELVRLVRWGYNWHSPRTQCLVGYFLMTRRHQMNYDPNMCDVQDTQTLLELIQMFDSGYTYLEEASALTGKSAVQLLEEDEEAREQEQAMQDVAPMQPLQEMVVNEPEPSDMQQVVPDDYSDVDLDAILENPAFNTPMADAQPVDVAEQAVENEKERQMEDIVRQLMSVQPRQTRAQPPPIPPQYEYDYGMPVYDDGAPAEEAYEDPALNDYDYESIDNDELQFLIDAVNRVKMGEDVDLSALTPEQLDRFISYINIMKSMLSSSDQPGETEGEVGYALDLDPDQQKLLLKKDLEQVKDVDNGLTQVAHNIVKGPYLSSPIDHQLHRIQGNTVYIKLNKDVEEDRGRLLHLFSYLEDNVARPNNLTFLDFSVEGNELSFRVLDINSQVPSEAYLADVFKKPNPDILKAETVAAKIYKRKEDIGSLVGAEVQETGIGESPDTVAIGRESGVVVPTLVACGIIVGVLVSVLGAYVYKNRHSARSKVKQIAADLEAQSTKAYEELCRQRMAGSGDKGVGPLSNVINTLTSKLTSTGSAKAKFAQQPSPRSSTSSWSEEPAHSSDMDITTGHVILSYLEEHLQNEHLLEQEWASLVAYRADDASAFISVDGLNLERNRDSAVLPYDRNRIKLHKEGVDIITDYINASPIYDADPKNPAYIAAQGPMADTAADLWQMVWEQGSVVIVNLTRLAENGTNKCYRYWPENGSDIHGNFEIHLVSEHIWCEDYVVRSFYLKNLNTTETRTVTQFHYLSWPDHQTPSVPKPLLEFRRKVNKSYRGRLSPIVVHCSDGAGRTGTYILLDMVLNRICKGVKEINVAATLEHIRDQRMKMVETKEHYEFVLTGIAEEVHAILKAIPN